MRARKISHHEETKNTELTKGQTRMALRKIRLLLKGNRLTLTRRGVRR
jgi:hypothetical protein